MKSKQKIIFYLTLLFIFFVSEQSTLAQFKLSAFGSGGTAIITGSFPSTVIESGSARSETKLSFSQNSKPIGYGGGIGLEYLFVPYLGLETGFIFMHTTWDMNLTIETTFTLGSTTSSASGTYHIVQSGNVGIVPLMLKLWLGNVIYISGGGFASEPIGDFETSVNGSNSSTTNGIEKKLDYGYGGGIGLNIPIGGIGLFFDGLYLKGINNLNDSPGATLKVATLIARAGLRF